MGRSGGQTGSAPLRPGRQGEAGRRNSPGRAGEEWRAITWPTGAGKPAELPGQYPALQSPLQVLWLLGGTGRRLRGDQERQVGGALPDWRSRRGDKGICPAHSSPGRLLASEVRSPAL